MTGQWQTFLIDAGAVPGDDGRVLHFGNPSREQHVATTGTVFADLSHFGVVRAAGDDALTFLQGQLTTDLDAVGDHGSRLAGYCTPKGRLLAIARVFRGDGSWLLRLPAALRDPVMERLRKYVLMARVTLEDAGDALVRIGVSGPDAERELGTAVEAVPAGVDTVARDGDVTVVRVPGIQPRFEVYAPRESMERIWALLDVRAAPVGADAWELLDVLAGIPEVLPETVEEFVPQTINLDLVGGVSFQKGCYTGQEIVARVHYRGTVKRRMYLAHYGGAERPAPGTAVHAPGAGEQAIGTVVRAAPAPDGGFLLLASLARDHAARTDLELAGDPGNPLALRELPGGMPDGAPDEA